MDPVIGPWAINWHRWTRSSSKSVVSDACIHLQLAHVVYCVQDSDGVCRQ